MNTERNWLIRTTQNQILGPVAKAKVLEFLQKGALGLNDEVSSGNGFWFSLKEKDLVEKYLYGDVPQGYNPISESKSILSKRDHPDRTTSLNTSPANKTQVLKTAVDGPSAIPKSEDLEYPDITLINKNPVSTAAPAVAEAMKLPNQDDLEFPDITMVARPGAAHSGHEGMQTHVESSRPVEVKTRPPENRETASADGPAVYPAEDDLAFPDMNETAEKPPADEDINFQVSVPSSSASASAEAKPVNKKGVLDFKDEGDSNLTLMFDTLSHHKEQKPAPKEKKAPALQTTPHHQPEKLLHERKVKASAHPKETAKEIPAEVQETVPDRSMPEHLKKRNDNYLLYLLVIIVLIILGLFFYYYSNILNKPLPV